MKNLMILSVATIALIGCGDDLKRPDASVKHDATHPDYCSTCPAAPTLGTQIDRLGRPAINTVLNHGFDGNAGTAGPAKDTYNQDATISGWAAAYAAQFMVNLAIVDSLDVGLSCTAGACTPEAIGHCSVTTTTACFTNATCALLGAETCVGAPVPGDKCGNQVLYNGMPGGQIGSPTATSYQMLAGILADDQLYLDTTKPSCDLASHQNYLALEFNVVTGVPNSTCGGRAPTNDVIDTSYTALAVGINGFKVDGTYTPVFGDGAGPHITSPASPHDVSNDVFPFLGTPH